jgi:signal transduction histidine kinase
MQVDFVHENVPRGLPGNAALCLFRIAQEGVRNVKKHSGANWAEVRLELLEEKLHLSVSDHGKGFDSSEHSIRGGIGLRSMEERLRLLGGQLEIHSQSTKGTRIDAWIPFTVASERGGVKVQDSPSEEK